MTAFETRRECAECGTEFAVGETNKAARRCPACLARARRNLYSRTFGAGRDGGGEVRVEVRGHLSRPIPYEPPRRPRPEPAWLEAAR